jgi:hypothetical protein
MKRRPDEDDAGRDRASGNGSSDLTEVLARFFHKHGRYFLYAAIALGILVVVVVVVDRLAVK